MLSPLAKASFIASVVAFNAFSESAFVKPLASAMALTNSDLLILLIF